MPADRPNILFMHVDQMHFAAVSAYGNPHLSTPGIDRMVEDGYSFMTSHTPMPQCCPVRASWYTGRSPTEHGVPVNSQPLLPHLPDLGQWLRKHGSYDCVYAGKWHVPNRNHAQSFRVIYGSGKGEFADAPIARAAMGYLANCESDKPFFLNVGFMNPHDCCYTAGAAGGSGKFRFAREIEDKLPPLPLNFKHDKFYAGRTAGWGELEWRYYIYSYYRYVEMVDAEIARVYDALKASRFAKNTVVVFTSDHGDGLGFHGKVSKGYLEDEAFRVPAVVVYPERIKANIRDSKHLVSGIDIPATICDYAEVPGLPKTNNSHSWRPLLEGKDMKWRDWVVGEVPGMNMQAAIRDARFKTIFYENPELGARVYDMLQDPLEKNDIAARELGKQVEARHLSYLKEYISGLELAKAGPKSAPLTRKIYDRYNAWYGSILKKG